MATVKEGWPLLYGGWKSYREWADNGFVPKEAPAKRRGRHEGRAAADESGEPDSPRSAAGRAPAQPETGSPAGGRAPAAPGGHGRPGTVPPAAPRASPGHFAPPAADPFAPRPVGTPYPGDAPYPGDTRYPGDARYPEGTRPRREPAPFYVQHAMPPEREPAPSRDLEPPPPSVRPYVMTSGRTRTRRDLAIHALVSTTGHGHAAANRRLPEQRAICLLCRDPHSVAEVAAALDVPLGVARVLIDDMAHQGLVVVHGLREGGTSLELLGRVLDGLRRL